IRDSVTVSMALDTRGTRREISRVSRLVVSTSLGTTSVSPGSSSTSSYVSPSTGNLAAYASSLDPIRSLSNGFIAPSPAADVERSHLTQQPSRTDATTRSARLSWSLMTPPSDPVDPFSGDPDDPVRELA